jgi:hypothetical protein
MPIDCDRAMLAASSEPWLAPVRTGYSSLPLTSWAAPCEAANRATTPAVNRGRRGNVHGAAALSGLAMS